VTVDEQNPGATGLGRDLTGQIALVTGAGSGIGKAIAIALAAAGASVAICDRAAGGLSATEDDIRSGGDVVLATPADVSHREDVDRMAAGVESELGPVDLLVNNAGVHGPFGPFADTDPEEWWRTMEVNLRGCVYCMRAILPGMIGATDGS
jgi:NAD(P)-dependent dehydrogenase (short-subunit alcohol dehydrogenase family)